MAEVITTTRRDRAAWSLWLLVIGVALAFATCYLQWFDLGDEFIREKQQARHRRVLTGTAPDPWQYRLLSEWLAWAVIRVCRRIGIPQPVVWGFLALRFAQNLAIFLLAARYFQALGLGRRPVLLGLGALASGVASANYDSDLSLNTYSDVLLYLVAAILLVSGRQVWILPITLAAALNRETGALIPLMAIAAGLAETEDTQARSRAIQIGTAALVVFATAYLGVRAYLGPRELFLTYGHPPGVEVAIENLSRANTWARLVLTGGLFPVFALLALRVLPRVLKAFALTILPAWALVHVVASVMAESRLFLAPLAVVIIPAGLFAFEHPAATATTPRS